MLKRSTKSSARTALRFDRRLVLHQWMLGLFEAGTFEDLARHLRDPGLEGLTPDNTTRFCEALTGRLFERGELSRDILLGYDANIVRHWRAITERRSGTAVLWPKYFQYLSLLFTEIYLDRYFRDRARLLEDLNAHTAVHNGTAGDTLPEYTADDLRKLAFWSATGSGKTLLMHANILQYRHYQAEHGRSRELNRVILLTPNEGLSRQHLAEFRLSGMPAELFAKEGGGLYVGQNIEIIDINKLREEGKQKTVTIEAFEGNNLVLVDEGHRGTGGDVWKGYRDALSAQGFAFEYSATFGQAMKAANKPALTAEYARCILFDYSYKYFYGDGYGKDYRILNLEDDGDANVRGAYLTACVLAFYQQVRLYRDRGEEFRRFLLERPLWVFVGASVNAVRTESSRKVSDVVDILLFLAELTANEGGRTVRRMDDVLRGRAGLRDGGRHEIFAHTFGYLIETGMSAAEMFADLLRLVFNAPGAGRLHVAHLKGAEGELALSIGENEPFGVINVGDAAALYKLCEAQPELVAEETEFAGSYFQAIDRPGTTINLLIGSKKFTEGWNSWRVSTMGLMNIGRSEGSEIVQLFGRGVRLKGLGFCLKRSRAVGAQVIGAGGAPKHILTLETLNIFGIRADYMRQFREYLEEEGLPPNENRVEFVLPVLKMPREGALRLPRLKAGIDFKRTGPKPTLEPMGDAVPRVALDWYPKIQARISRGAATPLDAAERHEGALSADHVAFIDMDAVYFAMQRFKNERGWFNLNVTQAGIGALLGRTDWYRLYIPPAELEFTSFAQVARWQELAVALLAKYGEALYRQCRKAYEADFMEYQNLGADDPNLIEEYSFLVEESRQDMLEILARLAEDVRKGVLKDVEFSGLQAMAFGRHLYQPLIHLKSDAVEVSPVALNEGERDFVADLRAYHEAHPEFFAGRELYLLRNQSRGRGLGFFEAGNFHPDFILWLVCGERQYVTFVDPKGLRNLEGWNDPKIQFYRTIKELEERLADPAITLNSFIVSTTEFREIRWWDAEKGYDDLEAMHILFQKENRGTYIGRMLGRVVEMTEISNPTE